MKTNKLLAISAILIAASIILLSIMFCFSGGAPGLIKKKETEIQILKAQNLQLLNTVDSLKISLEISGFVIDKYQTCVMLLEEESKDCWVKFDSIYKNHE